MLLASGRSYVVVSTTIIFLFFHALIPAQGQAFASQEQSPATYKLNGTVLNAATGDPVAHAMAEIINSGSGKPMAVLTDLGGHFEFDGLPEAQSMVTVTKPGFFSEQQLNRNYHQVMFQVGPDAPSVTVKLVPEAILFGRVDSNDGPAENLPVKVFWATVTNGRRQWQRRETRTDDEGNFRLPELLPDTYYIAAGPGVDYNEAQMTGLDAAAYFPTLFHAGSSEFSGATPVTLAAGQQVEVDFSVKKAKAYTLTGKILGGDFTNGISLELKDRFGEPSSFPTQIDIDTRKFSIRAPAGSYVLRGSSSGVDGNILRGELALTVSGDRSNLEVVLAPSPGIAVHLRADSSASVEQQAVDGGFRFAHLSNMQLASVHLITTGDTINSRDYWPDQRPDNTSPTFHNLEPGKYTLEVVPNGPWYVESATCGGTDLLRDELDFSGHAEPIEVVLRNGGANIQGKARSGSRPIHGEVLVVPDAAPREIKTANISEDGSFFLASLAPGGYSLLALDHLDEIEYRNLEILNKYLSKAEHINLDSQQSLETTIELTEVEK